MSHKHGNLARVALAQQVEFLGGIQISLDSLWRAWGRPEGHDPRRWSEVAAPLLSGFAAYLDRLHGPAVDPEGEPVLWTWHGTSKDPWRAGDTMTYELIAWAYATYLDDLLGRHGVSWPVAPESGVLPPVG